MIPRTREALSELLARTFPASEDIDAATVDAFVDALMQVRAGASIGELAAPVVPPTAKGEGESTLYSLRATHARRTPVTSVFTGETHSVRVRLGREEALSFDTPIGEVLPADRLLPTVEAVRERFGEQLDRDFTRVDLITPARHSGIRFAPMALYFGYEHEDSAAPFFVVYEPGEATGKPGALYLAERIDRVIEQQAGYVPTPFSSADHWYTGGLRMAANGRDPEVLHMRASVERGGEAHFRLHVEYSVLGEVPLLLPAQGLVEAALRMLAVQRGVGFDQNLVERLVAEAGLLVLPWIDRPDNGPLQRRTGAGPHGSADLETSSVQPFEPNRAFEPFVDQLPARERATFEASIVMLLAEVVRVDGTFDRLERIEIDWLMSFEVPSGLGDAFRFSDAAAGEYRALLEGATPIDPRPFDARLAELGDIVRRLPTPLREQYTSFVQRACRRAAASSGRWLWFGTKVSAEEKDLLDRIAAALQLDASDESTEEEEPPG